MKQILSPVIILLILAGSSCKKESTLTSGDPLIISSGKFSTGIQPSRGGGGFSTGVQDTLSSSFNCTPIPAGRYIWFNAHLVVSGLTTDPATFTIIDQHITFTSNNIPYDIPVANTTVIYSTMYQDVSYVYDPVTGWTIHVPYNYTGNVFFAGIAFQSPGLSGCINPVNWYGTFSSDQPMVNISWAWGAAVYTTFSEDYNNLDLQITDGCYKVGSPVRYACYVTAGAKGNGGSNLTGNFTPYNHLMLP